METYTPGQLARVLRLPEPTAEQAAVIGAPLGPLAIVAGAGSGKSETMAARLVWLVANGMVRPDRVLGLTFTRKAAAELAERVRTRLDALRRAGLAGAPADEDLGPWAGDPVISTYHAYAGRLVSDHALREGLEPSMRLITAALSWQLASSIVAAYDGPMDEVQWTPQTVTAAVLELAGDLSEHLRSSADVRGVGRWLETEAARWPGRVLAQVRQVIDAQRTREQLLPLVDRYAAAKRAREVLDHGDQVAIAARIADRHPEVGAAERTRYQAVLLDEYQDTSHAQLVLLRALFGGGHPVTAVGDPCQSIYGWRGASAGNLRRFAQDFRDRSDRPAPVRQLSTSFRNAGRVLEAAAVLQVELRAQAPDVPVLQPAPDRGGRGGVCAALLATMTAEADWVAAQAAALLALPAGTAPDGQPWPDGRAAGVRPSDIAVLCRKRSQFVPLRRALEARGIPCEVVGLGGLLSVPEVQDVVATLRVLHDASTSDALARLLTGPRWRIGPRDLVALGRRARYLAAPPASPSREGSAREGAAPQAGTVDALGTGDPLIGAVTDLTTPDSAASLVEALDDLGDQAEYSAAGYARLSALAAETRRLREHVTRPLADLIAEVERALSLDIEVAARPGGDMAAARADLDAFTDVAVTFAGDQPEPTLGAFIAYLAAAQQEEFGLETGPGWRVGHGEAAHRARRQGPAVAGGVHPRARRGGEVARLPRPAEGTDPLDAQPPADPVPAARRRRRPARADLARRGLRRGVQRGLRGPRPGGGAPARLRRGDAGRVLARLLRLLVGRGDRAARPVGVPHRGPRGVRGRRRDGRPVGGRAAQDAENPLLAAVDEADWPADSGRPAVRRGRGGGGGLVDEARTVVQASRDSEAGRRACGPSGRGTPTPPSPARGELNEQERELIAAWELDDRPAARRARAAPRRGDGPVEVMLPARLSVSALVALARDPDELARQVRRPMPQPPARQARRGTALHLWLEERFGQQRLIGDDDLFAADEDARQQEEDLEWAPGALQGGRMGRPLAPGGGGPVEHGLSATARCAAGSTPSSGRPARRPASTSSTGRPASPAHESGERTPSPSSSPPTALPGRPWPASPLNRVRSAFYYVRHDKHRPPRRPPRRGGLRDLINRVPKAG